MRRRREGFHECYRCGYDYLWRADEWIAVDPRSFEWLCGSCFFVRAKERLLRTLADPPRLRSTGLVAGGLVRRVSLDLFTTRGGRGVVAFDAASLKVPWGWRVEHEIDRNCVLLMPAWFYWLRRLRMARWYVERECIRLGFLQGPEGGLFTEFHWSWRVWESNYNRYGHRARWFAWWRRFYFQMHGWPTE